MNVRKSLFVVTFAVLAAPLAAYADAPSGDFDSTHPASSKEVKADRSGNANYAEFSVDELTGKSATTREEVKRELASSGMPHVEA
jgi:hypothetical protein